MSKKPVSENPIPPQSPINLSAVVAPSPSVTLAWKDNSVRETGYRIERGTSATTFSQIAVVGQNVASYTDKQVKAGQKYWYRVRAYNAYGNSTYTNVVSVTTPAATQPAPVPVPPSPTPPPTQPPEPQPVPQPAGSDPRTDYPVAFPYSSLPQDAQGWTIFNPSIDSKIFHVAPTGSDANDGTESKPLKTVAKAMSLARSGYPDQILLQCGGSYGKVGQWTKGGRSKTEPMVLGSYGTGPRPIIGQIYSSEGATINNFAMVGIHVYAKDRDYTAPGFDLAKVQDQQYGLDWFASGSGIHFEDCRISFWWYNVYLHGGQVVFRRNIVDHAWTKSGEKAQGMYISGGPTLKDNGPSLTLEENVIHHNGWAEFKDGAPPKGNKMGVWTFSHGIYTAEHCGPILYRRVCTHPSVPAEYPFSYTVLYGRAST